MKFFSQLGFFTLVILSGSPVIAQSTNAPVGIVDQMACAPTRREVAAVLTKDSVWITTDDSKTWINIKIPSAVFDDETSARTDAEFVEHTTFEPAPFEEQQMRIETDFFEIKNEPEDTPTQDDVSMAVSDEGTWAVATGGRLIVGDKMGIHQQFQRSVDNLIFDGFQTLWATSNNELLAFESVGSFLTSRKFPMNRPQNPVIGNEAQMLVPSLDGLWVVDIKKMEASLLRQGSVDAVSKNGDDLFLIANRRLILFRDGHEEDLGALPGEADRLVVDNENTIQALINNQWFIRDRQSQTWLHHSIENVVTDAHGRLWLTTNTGLAPPNQKNSKVRRPEQISVDLPILLSAAGDKLSKTLGPVPCRRSFNPLPKAAMTASWGRRSRDSHVQSGSDTWFFWGAKFTWTFDSPDSSSCLIKTQARNELLSQKLSEIEKLWAMLRQTHEPMEQKKLLEMLRILSGIDPAKEKP